MAPRGRPKGKRDAVPRMSPARKLSAEAAGKGETPLKYMLRVMRNSKADPDRRDRMAVAAAPFIHPRLANVQHAGGDEDGTLKIIIERAD